MLVVNTTKGQITLKLTKKEASIIYETCFEFSKDIEKAEIIEPGEKNALLKNISSLNQL